jgi:prephenate dehydrogenase
MSEIQSVAIIGLGLIGGSLARDLAARGVRVAALDKDLRNFQDAYLEGVVSDLVAWGDDTPIRADVVILAVPVLAAWDVFSILGPHLQAARLVTDVGSTKRSIMMAAAGQGLETRFVGSHPLAGDHRSGWEASRTGLFRGARVYLTPTQSTDADALELARELWTMVGAVPRVMDAAEHDRRLAWTSHLPQVASTALALALAESGIQRPDLGPGGRDVTRLAGSSPEMWADILIDNADEAGSALAAMSAHLSAIGDAVASGDRDRLRELWAIANQWHAERPGTRSGPVHARDQLLLT